MIEYIQQHQFWSAVAAYWIFSAAVSSMAEPTAASTAGYLWVYRFCHIIAGNLTTAFGSKLPGVKTLTATSFAQEAK